jgi:hypothetical protein
MPPLSKFKCARLLAFEAANAAIKSSVENLPLLDDTSTTLGQPANEPPPPAPTPPPPSTNFSLLHPSADQIAAIKSLRLKGKLLKQQQAEIAQQVKE